MAFAFTVMMAVILIGGSIWIMHNVSMNMMSLNAASPWSAKTETGIQWFSLVTSCNGVSMRRDKSGCFLLSISAFNATSTPNAACLSAN